MHKLLARQIRRHFGSLDQVPTSLLPFLEAVTETYAQADADRAMLEHSMETVSQELGDRFREVQGALAATSTSQAELQASASLLQAAFDATADGLLVVSLSGTITAVNRQFFEMWRIPPEVAESGEDADVLGYGVPQLADPDAFFRKVQELYNNHLAESFDILHFKDGRIFERYSRPQMLGAEVTGRVWSFRDITTREAVAAVERRRHAQLELAAELSQLGSWESEIGTGEIRWSASMSRLMGLDAVPRIIPVADALKPYHPDDIRDLNEAMHGAEPAPGPRECRVTLPGGNERVHSVSWRHIPATASQPARMVGVNLDITDQKQREATLRERERLLAESQHVARIGSWSLELPSGALTLSEEFFRRYGLDPTQASVSIETVMTRVHPDDQEAVGRWVIGLRNGDITPIEHRVLRPDGTISTVFVQGEPVFGADGRKERLVGTIQDVTGVREMELQLRQAQKMEAVGRLAGGVAHDFNNLLMVVMGHTDYIHSQLPEDHRLRTNAAAIRRAADRAQALTRQLLAFSRKQILKPAVVSVNALVDDILPMLHRLIGEDIQLTTDLGHDLPPIMVDRGQLDQVLMNLVINARDAMPNGGTIAIETRTVTSPHGDGAAVADQGHGWIELVVADTGTGMDADTKAQIFEPFFTTKGPSHGTGLGLSTVFGIVAQSGGRISVDSEPQEGARFYVALPATARPQERAHAEEDASGDTRGTETILFAEDEAGVRELAVEALRAQGYTVIEAADGREAQRLAEQYAGQIDMLVSDVIMPHAGGREVAMRVRELRADTKVLLCSGYTNDVLVRAGVSSGEVAFLEKPYDMRALVERVRQILDAPGGDAGA